MEPLLRNCRLLVALCLSILTVLACTNCTNKSDVEKEKMQMLIDSLQQANEKKLEDLSDLTEFVGVLADGLDSIAYQEEVLFSNKSEQGRHHSKEELKQNLEFFENLLAEQKEKMQRLTDSLRAKGVNIERLNALVAHLNKQLEEKNATIKQLRADLDKRNVDISQLNKRVKSLSDDNDKLTSKVERQKETLVNQSLMLNEGFVKIGTKQELKKEGIIVGGFFKKSTLNIDNVDKTKFEKVDISKYNNVIINSDKIKILTPMPSTSYQIVRERKQSTIFITDPTSFWSISNCLIIQTN